ncbi:hypothetical protein BTVI_143692 [Pitangus sulphuratus]|nr:hypothetical protein BTVI_143692 [Pitangus sulphuratus]
MAISPVVVVPQQLFTCYSLKHSTSMTCWFHQSLTDHEMLRKEDPKRCITSTERSHVQPPASQGKKGVEVEVDTTCPETLLALERWDWVHHLKGVGDPPD